MACHSSFSTSISRPQRPILGTYYEGNLQLGSILGISEDVRVGVEGLYMYLKKMVEKHGLREETCTGP